MALNTQQSHTLSLFCETLVYGVFSVAILAVLRILSTDKRLTFSRKMLFYDCIMLFLLASGHMAIELYSVYVVVSPIAGTQASVVIAMVTGILGDAIVIWRVWHVWGRRWWTIVIPCAATLVAFVIGIMSAAVLTSPNQLNNILPIPTAALALTSTALNTFMIAGRLIYQQWHNRRVLGAAYQGSGNNHLTGVILMIFESGAILFSGNLVALVLEKLNNPATHVVLNMIEPLFGLVPTVMLVLVHMNIAVGNHTNKQYTESLSAVRFGSSTRVRRNGGLGTVTIDTSIPTIAEFKEHTGTDAKIVHGASDDNGYTQGKLTHEVHELMNFAANSGMV
ncbi:hypothetical protein PHLGIDRAFT_121238 [Phlebiopsis gigantea 11061_1 CR5-6]|uniref:Uncharacterized protein n=1 Tax=Phlebiopsis gigantea (strain 11061_1 CR5-6) TaxID=745531 RepID=A0A0C3PEI6_PHLG1|nr:hypothetical protein PHLGIDRAFT_121238 [Phlebiopsis gigantea 11061_1 CR5-6]